MPSVKHLRSFEIVLRIDNYHYISTSMYNTDSGHLFVFTYIFNKLIVNLPRHRFAAY